MSSIVKKASEGVISTMTDFTLFSLFYFSEIVSMGPTTLRKTDIAGEKALDTLGDINYAKIKRALSALKRKGFIKTVKNSLLEPQITALGRSRLRSIVPQYLTKRPWGGNIYLVTYDIPVKQNRKRDLLREYLRRIGCGFLQESIWISPYNPTEIIKGFTKTNNLQGTILVSVLGKDASIGDMTLEELIEEVYNLSELNSRYKEFIDNLSTGELSKQQIIFSYLSILQDDPQLPFKLLPDNWLGDKAYKLFKKVS